MPTAVTSALIHCVVRSVLGCSKPGECTAAGTTCCNLCEDGLAVVADAIIPLSILTHFAGLWLQTMFDPSTQDFWTQCTGRPCAGVWSSPAGNTPKYYINFSNPAAADWWVTTYVGEALRAPEFDGVYFDCSCGSPPGDAFAGNPAAVARFEADAQAAFDRAVTEAAAAGKWASAWNSEGGGSPVDPPWKGITQGNCAPMMDSWLQIGADRNLALQPLGVPFFANGRNPFPPGPPPPPPPVPVPGCSKFTLKQNFCARAPGSPVISARLHTSPVTCCKLCMADPTCRSWTLDATNASLCVCYLQTIVNDPDQGHSAVGCISGIPPPPPSLPPPRRLSAKARDAWWQDPEPAASGRDLVATAEPYFSQNNTIAAFLIAVGQGGGFIELPVCGAFEAMNDYNLSNPLLGYDFGAPIGPGRADATGRYSREYQHATIRLDCTSWKSTFDFRH